MTTRFVPGDNSVVENTQFAIGATTHQLDDLVNKVVAAASAGYASHAAAREITGHIAAVQTDLANLGTILAKQAGWKE